MNSKVLFYLAHPSQFHVFRELINRLLTDGSIVEILIKTKDNLEELLIESNLKYTNIFNKVKKSGKLSLVKSVIEKNYKIYSYLRKSNFDFVISAASDISQVTKLIGIPSFIFNDDDIHIIPNSAKYGWPFSTVIFAPSACDMGKFRNKTIYYSGYQKLAYLHPKVFKPDNSKVQNKIGVGKSFLIRSVSLSAHHDKNIRGLNYELISKLINKLKLYGKVFISSEKELPTAFNEYKLDINPLDIHHLIYYSEFLIGDSQSMAHEAALLGTPSIRFNDFAGRIGVLEELEHKYKLTYGINPDNPEKLFNKIDEFLKDENLKKTYLARRDLMLEDMIDVNQFAYWFINNYPKSLEEFKANPAIQYQFK